MTAKKPNATQPAPLNGEDPEAGDEEQPLDPLPSALSPAPPEEKQ
jgi:hypothetical protein